MKGLSSKPQLPAASVEAKDVKDAKDGTDAKGVGGPPPADIINRMIQKIQSASDLDMAIAMSSPSNWKSLMEELLAKPATTESSEAASAQPESAMPNPAETLQKT